MAGARILAGERAGVSYRQQGREFVAPPGTRETGRRLDGRWHKAPNWSGRPIDTWESAIYSGNDRIPSRGPAQWPIRISHPAGRNFVTKKVI